MSTIERISVGFDGSDPNGSSDSPDISPDGLFVAFVSQASNLVPEDTNGVSDIFLADRQSGAVERVSVAADGTEANGASGALTDLNSVTPELGEPPAVSSDGRFVAFGSDATNLVANDQNGARDIFLVDRQADTVTRVSTSELGQVEDGASSNPTMTPDGRFMAFVSAADNLVAGDGDGKADVFLFDSKTGDLSRISDGAYGLGLDVVNVSAGAPAISSDGRYVAFGYGGQQLADLPHEGGTGPVPTQPNVEVGALVYDRQTGSTAFLGRETTYTDNDFFNPASTQPAISGDGTKLAFVNGHVGDTFVQGLDTLIDLSVYDLAAGSIATTINHAFEFNFYDLADPINSPSLTETGDVVALIRDVSTRLPGHRVELVGLATGFDPTLAEFHNFIGGARLADGGEALAFGAQEFSGQPVGTIEVFVTDFPGGPDFTLPEAVERQAFDPGDLIGANFALTGQDVQITYLDEAARFQNTLVAYLEDADGTRHAPTIGFPLIEDASTAPGIPTDVRPGGGPLSSGDDILLSSLFTPDALAGAVQFGLALIADGARLNPASWFDPAKGQLQFGAGFDASLEFVPNGGGTPQEVQGDLILAEGPFSPVPGAPGQSVVYGAAQGSASGIEVRFEDLDDGDSTMSRSDSRGCLRPQRPQVWLRGLWVLAPMSPRPARATSSR